MSPLSPINHSNIRFAVVGSKLTAIISKKNSECLVFVMALDNAAGFAIRHKACVELSSPPQRSKEGGEEGAGGRRTGESAGTGNRERAEIAARIDRFRLESSETKLRSIFFL